jgi:hypothetical protein
MLVEQADSRIPLDEIRLGRGEPLPRFPTPRAFEVSTEWDRESSLDAGERGTETLSEPAQDDFAVAKRDHPMLRGSLRQLEERVVEKRDSAFESDGHRGPVFLVEKVTR